MSYVTLLMVLICLQVYSENATTNQKPINIIWQTNAYFEPDWLKEVFSEVYTIEHSDGNFQLLMDNSVIIMSFNQDSPSYFAKLQELNYKFAVVMLSDEWYQGPTYFYPHAKFVLRNYWHKMFAGQKNVYSFPLGYKNGFWLNYPDRNQLKKAAERKFTWSFAGQVTKSTRGEMYQSMTTIPNYHVHTIFGFNTSDSLSTQSYRDLLLDSVFAPCPRGFYNLDSFRVCEALECGCIPIVEKFPLDYFAGLFDGNYPFPAVNAWSEAPVLINELMADPDRLEKLRIECHEWWIAYKNNLKRRIAGIVEEAFKD